LKLEELLKIISKTAVDHPKIGIPYLCGGTPRDYLMGNLEKISDLDITTGTKTIDYLAENVLNILNKQYNIPNHVAKDGHISLHIGDLKLDFSSNFIEPNIINHLKAIGIKYPTAIQQEMFSRDFTCNSLLLTLDFKQLLDPTGKGKEDVKNKIIKTCLSPEITFQNSTNRVIRSIYLAVKLGFEISPDIIDYVKAHPETTAISSQKAMTEKLNKSLSIDREKTIRLITAMGIWDYIPVDNSLYNDYIKNRGQNVG